MCPRAGDIFAIGEHTHEEARELHSKRLAEVLEKKRQERAGRTEGIAATMAHGISGVDETKPLAFRNS